MKKDVKEVIKSKVVYVKACLVIFSYVTIMFLIYTCFLFMSHKDEEAKSKLVGNPKQCDWNVSTIRYKVIVFITGLYMIYVILIIGNTFSILFKTRKPFRPSGNDREWRI